MENLTVKELREKYGIHDSRNEYTEEQLIDLSQRKLFFISHNEVDGTNDIHINVKQVFGYVSEDETACIFIKNEKITGENCYIPMARVDNCTVIKEGMYHDRLNKIVYCTTSDLLVCIKYLKESIKAKIQEQITEIEQELLLLKNTNIRINFP